MSVYFEETIQAGQQPKPLVVPDELAGASLVLEVTATNPYGSTSARSASFGPIVGGAMLDVHITAQTASTVTLGWTPAVGALGYQYLLDGQDKLTDNKRHFTFDGSVSSVKIGRPPDGKPHRYGVRALLAGPSGEVQV